MGGRRVVFALGTVFIFLAPANACDDEIEERKATCDREATAFDALDFKAYVATAHEQVILFGIFPPFALEGIEPYRQRYQTRFATHQSVTFTPLNPQFRIIGNIGVAWGGTTRWS